MTPGQVALDNAIRLRISEMSKEHGRLYFITDWVIVLAGQEMNHTNTTFVFTETRGPGEVPVHSELGLLEYASARLRTRIFQFPGKSSP